MDSDSNCADSDATHWVRAPDSSNTEFSVNPINLVHLSQWDRARGTANLTNSQVLLMLLLIAHCTGANKVHCTGANECSTSSTDL